MTSMDTTTTATVALGNGETAKAGIFKQSGGDFLALTLSVSRTFKTYQGAKAWMAKMGYTATGARIAVRSAESELEVVKACEQAAGLAANHFAAGGICAPCLDKAFMSTLFKRWVRDSNAYGRLCDAWSASWFAARASSVAVAS